MEIKGIIHVHSTYSYDGKLSLSELRELLLEKGMSFCFVTEHTDFLTTEQAQLFVQECKALSGSQFVFIPGFEVPYKNAHVLLLGTEVFLSQHADAQILAQWASRASLTVLAHPVRNRFVVDEALLSALSGIEIWNQQYEGKKVPRPRSVELLRSLQEKKPGLLATGGIDLHRVEHFGSPVYTVEVEHLTAEAVTEALKNGSYIFGNKKVAVSSAGLWRNKGSVAHNAMSFYSVSIIAAGKTVNKVLARYGLAMPKGLKSFIRSRT
jgi:predicted metal-dependent phosphoesterase TrpH